MAHLLLRSLSEAVKGSRQAGREKVGEVMTPFFFTSPERRTRFLTTIQRLDKVDHGTLDPEYAAALYILCADSATWEKAAEYTESSGIDFEAMLQNLDWS